MMAKRSARVNGERMESPRRLLHGERNGDEALHCAASGTENVDRVRARWSAGIAATTATTSAPSTTASSEQDRQDDESNDGHRAGDAPAFA